MELAPAVDLMVVVLVVVEKLMLLMVLVVEEELIFVSDLTLYMHVSSLLVVAVLVVMEPTPIQ